MTPKTAKLFITGGSQAVRLPAEFRFDGDVVFVRRDASTGDVVLSNRPRADWASFIKLRSRLGCAPLDFLASREQGSSLHDPFQDHSE